MSTKKDKHPDIVLLETKLDSAVKEENYERAVILKKWIESLKEHYGKKSVKKNNKRTTS